MTCFVKPEKFQEEKLLQIGFAVEWWLIQHFKGWNVSIELTKIAKSAKI